MAKFKDLHLLLQEEQQILFGDDSLSGPVQYPATASGNVKPFMSYTTISGYNTTYPGMGVSSTAATEELVVSVPIAGERGTQEYHLVRFDQLQEAIFDEVTSDWQDSVLSFESNPPGSPGDGDRYIVEATASGVWNSLEDSIVEWVSASGIWDVYAPNEGFTTFVEDENKFYVYYDGAWGPMGEGIDHGDLVGLGDDDHTQYSLVTGARAFTGTVGGITPVADSDLTTKLYVDDAITSISGGNFDHGLLAGLDADDHTQYILVDGTRAFTGTVSGIDPTVDEHLTTKSYVDTAITTATGSLTSDHGDLTGLGDDDHLQYILVDGTRGFTDTVSGVDPTLSYHLATKQYVDDAVGGYDTFLELDDTYITSYTADNMLYTSSSGVHDTSDMTYDSATGDINLGVAGEPRLVIDADSDAKLHGDDNTYITVSGTGAAFVEGGSLEFSVTSAGIALAGGARVDDILNTADGDSIDASSTDTQIATAKLIYDAITTATGSLTSDHGDLTGLGDDDHTQYILVDGSRGFTSTVSGVYPVVDSDLTTKEYVDDQFSTLSGTRKWGRISCIDNARNQAVTFGTAFVDDDYTLVATLTNEVDSPPSIYSTIQGVKANTGFTTHFSGKMDSDNFILEWIAIYGQQS